MTYVKRVISSTQPICPEQLLWPWGRYPGSGAHAAILGLQPWHTRTGTA